MTEFDQTFNEIVGIMRETMKPKIRWKCPKCGAEFCAREPDCPACLVASWEKKEVNNDQYKKVKRRIIK